MIWPGRTIWDTRAQSVCGILSAKGKLEPELFGSATFAQFSLSPPRVIINPNCSYPIESAIQHAGRFAINVLPASERDLMIKLMRVRRRQPGKAKVLGIQLSEDAHGIPFLSESLRVVFCEVERTVETGDRRLYVARYWSHGSIRNYRDMPFFSESAIAMHFLVCRNSRASSSSRVCGIG